MRMVRWCIRLTRLTLVCEVIRYRLVQVRQNQKKKKKKKESQCCSPPSEMVLNPIGELSTILNGHFCVFATQSFTARPIFRQIQRNHIHLNLTFMCGFSLNPPPTPPPPRASLNEENVALWVTPITTAVKSCDERRSQRGAMVAHRSAKKKKRKKT